MDIVFNKKDGNLYVFGYLRSGTPEIMSVSADGKTTARINGMFLGSPKRFGSEHKRDQYVDEIWFIDPSNHVVLGLRKSDPKLVDYLVKGKELQIYFDEMLSDVQGKKRRDTSVSRMPEYGFISTISLKQKRMWVVPRHSGEGIPLG